MTKRVLITGGAGFVGSHLTRACLGAGWEVGIPFLLSQGLDLIKPLQPGMRVFPVAGDTNEIFKIFEQYKPELVFHLASVFISRHTPEEIVPLITSNITYGTQVLEAMVHFQVPYLVNTGTAWQHYENSSYNPVNLYAATKQAFEDLLAYYVEAHSLRAITLKLNDTYGPADPRPKLFTILGQAAREKTRLEMSPGEQFIDLVYIDDVVEAFITAARRLFSNEQFGHSRYVVSSGKPVRLRALVETYQAVTGQNLDLVWGGRPYREREVMIPWSNGERLPGWEPQTRLEEGIRKLWETSLE